VVRQSGKALADLKNGMQIFPQTMINVRMSKRFDLKASAPVQNALKQVENELASNGRVVLRSSGTEPVVRVMLEGRDLQQIQRLGQQLADTVKRAAEEAA